MRTKVHFCQCLHHGRREGEIGPLVRRLQSYGDLQGYVSGAWGKGSEALHSIVQTCAEARVDNLCQATGRHETKLLLGEVVGCYRRLVSTSAVRAAARPVNPGKSRREHPGRQSSCWKTPGGQEI